MERLRGVVERITFQSEDTGFSVLKCRVKNYHDLVTVVGTMPDIHVGSVLTMSGNWKMDAKYGRQFSLETFEETLPATVFGIEKYLGSGLIKGVGPKFAGRIVRQFGIETLNVIEEEPDRLLEVEGIGKLRVEKIKKAWVEQKEIKNIMLFLQGHNVSTVHATKIYKAYGNESIKVVQENPYRLADDIWGIGFKTADTIAEKLGFGHDKYVRLRSGLLYTLNRLSEDGHCYATRDMLMNTGAGLLEVEDNLLNMTLDEMIRASDVITENIPDSEKDREDGKLEKAIYLPPFYFSEVGTAKRLAEIQSTEGSTKPEKNGILERIRKKAGVDYDEVQLQAIQEALNSKILILTGGPGTGKTTTTLGIITAFSESGAKILLAAPTGRAAKRLSETTGREAKTIHRLLEMKPPEGYQKNEENPLEGDVLIVDECSMIDIMLMYNLLKAVPDTMTLILVGDIDQLPSVGAGNVLRDIIDSGCVPVVRLTRIFRQAQTSRIIMNAHRINEGKMPDLSNGKNTDFFFMEREDPEAALQTIVELVQTKLSRYYKVSSSQIQVLTPMQRGVVGAANLNQALQEKINPGETGLRRGGCLYKVADKVMQIRNNYDKEVFNGDIGVIESVDLEERELNVRFDDRLVSYDVSELDELVLAYATTIHKSQGSEYPIVVIPVLMNHYVMLQKNLIYTGITRAKKILVIVGTKKAVSFAVRNVKVNSRNTMLKDRMIRLHSEDSKKVEPLPFQEPRQKTNYQENESSVPVKMVAEARKPYASAGNQTESIEKTSRAEKSGSEMPLDNTLPGKSKPSHEEWLRIDLFERLSASAFRSRFHLTKADKAYIEEKGMETIRQHAGQIIQKRLAPASPTNDGKQTPMRGAPKGHPVFLAQHGTGTCCRGCLEKWHGIPKGRDLTKKEQDYVVDVLIRWIEKEY
ncbi:MAG: ATP-dependent RecD-like DNA helicase [Blautia sp.]|nr:ATP-dependent RecD-like DNA helicase [Blautia sp.]